MKNKNKFIRAFFLFGPSEIDKKKIRTIAKYKVPSSNNVKTYEKDDEDNAVALLCLPDGIQRKNENEEIKELFHSFLITKENGLRVYGSSLTIWDKIYNEQDKTNDYYSKSICLVTELPFIFCTKKILKFIWQNKCSIEFIRAICNINLPDYGKMICLKLPYKKNSDFQQIEEPIKIHIFPGTKKMPIFDYSLRYLFTKVLSVENFLIAFTATLLEHQILITSSSLFKLMLVSESLTNLLLPFKWQHVYVPILPSKLGLNYLDAPTPYIMGVVNYDENFEILNSNSGSISLSNSIRCKIDCDLNSVEFYAEEGTVNFFLDENHSSDLSDDENFSKDENNKSKSTFTVPKFLSDLQVEIESFLNSDLRLSAHLKKKNNNQAMERITKLALKHNVISKFTYEDEIKFNYSIRKMFLKVLTRNLLSNYERYIVVNKKDNIKFDSVSFLSDQSITLQNFLANFLKTQLFATFIDEKGRELSKNQLISLNTGLCIIDTDELNEETEQSSSSDELETNDLDKIFSDLVSISFSSLINLSQNYFSKGRRNSKEDTTEFFEQNLSSNAKFLTSPFKVYSPLKTNKNCLKKDLNTVSVFDEYFNQDDFKNFLNTPNIDNCDSKLIKNKPNELNSPMKLQTEAFAAQTNWRIVESLLKEVKIKTKKILIEKMADEEISSTNLNNIGDFEGNTLIASLCDLIERIWTHAKCTQNSQSRCAFWVHLSAFCKISLTEKQETPKIKNDPHLSPVLAWVKKKIDNMGSQIEYKKASKPFFRSAINEDEIKRKNLNVSSLNLIQCVPTTIFQDYDTINNMPDIKTEIGKSRAFIRLALERKLLSQHLRLLLSNQQLTCAFYKRFAFLRSEEEKEQFLTHLLTLNAVDLLPFTNTFTVSTFKYQLIFYGSSLFTGCFSLSGYLFELINQNISSPTNIYSFECKNLGVVNSLTLRITGTNKIYIEYCLLINEFTGQTYKFHCNRWLGKNIDDGACEFIVNCESITNEKAIDFLKKSLQSKGSSIGRQLTKAFDSERIEIIDADELKDYLGKSVNFILRLYGTSFLTGNLLNSKNLIDNDEDKFNSNLKSNNKFIKKINNKLLELNGQLDSQIDKTKISNLSTPLKTLKVKHQNDLNNFNRSNMFKWQHNLVKLLFGERQLLWVLNEIFYFDFKNKKKVSFKKQQFVWDFIDCIQLELKLFLKEKNFINQNALEENCDLTLTEEKNEQEIQCFFIEIVDKINNKAPLVGKDGKFQLFLLISLREHILSKFIIYFENLSLAPLYYGGNSFFTDQNKSAFLKQILISLNDVPFILDQSFTKGL